MKSKINLIWILLVISIMLFHGCVIKAQRQMQVRSCYDLRDKNNTEYEACKNCITYFSALANLKEVFHAWD